ncbi:MAG: BatA domain-containing protein [Phycisphaerales bacterium]
MNTLAVISLLFPGMLLGVALVALPIMAHLMHRRARRRVVFPSVELLASAAASRSSLFRLRRWWLLLLRCLAVIVVVLAFTQPVWQSAQAYKARGQSAAVVFLIDQSASTGQLHGGIPAVRTMLAEAEKVIDTLTPGVDHANIVYATARPYAAFPAMTANTDALRAELSELAPTYERADMPGALALATQLLRDHAGLKHLVIVTDLQASNWDDALKQSSHESPLPAGTRITLLPPQHAPPTNLSLHAPAAHPRTPRTHDPVNLTVAVTNHSDRVQSATVQLSVDGQPADSESLTMEPRQQREIAFATTLNRPGEHRIMFSLPADGLAVDDANYLVVRCVDHTPVTVITDDDTDTPRTAGYYLLRALAPHGDDRDRYEITIQHSTQTPWPPLDNAQAVFVGEVAMLSADQLTALHQYLQHGGCVVFFCGAGPVLENLSSLDALSPGGLLPWKPAAPRVVGNADQPLTITHGDWRSPLLNQFDESAQITLSRVPIRYAWTGGTVDERARTLLSYSDGTPALVSRSVGNGTLILANFSAASNHSDLGKQGLFVALMQGLAESMGRTDTPATPNTVGQAVHWVSNVPTTTDVQPPKVYMPDGRTPADATVSLDNSVASIVIHAPTLPGFYTAQQGETVLGTAAVNTDPRESDLRRVTADELIAALQPRTPGPPTQNTNAGQALNLRGRDLWGWLLFAAMVFLGIEMALLGYWKR